MKRLLCTVMALAACAPAWSADWAPVPTGDGNQHFYDRSKVFVTGEEVMYWRRVVFASAHPVRNGFARSAMYRERILCKQARIATMGYLLYAGDGSVLENVYTPDAEAAAIVPETVGDRFQRIMCALNVTGGDTPAPTPAARAPAPAAPAPAPAKEPAAKKPDNADDIRQEIDRLEQMLKRLRDKLGEQ